MATVSVVLATFNEEKNLPSCLDSVKDLTDEIVVVDGGSSDKTVEIAKKYGAKVKITTNKPIFHINKQMAIDVATKDWVLQLDADERVTPQLKNEVKKAIAKFGWNPSTPPPKGGVAQDDSGAVNGYWVPRKNWFLGRFLMKGGQYPDYTLRLYRRGKGRLPQKTVHEQAEVSGELGYLKHPLLHYPYKNFAMYLEKWNRYTDLIASQIKSKLQNKGFLIKLFYMIGYVFIKPIHWFVTTYIRHKGFYDLWPGLVFSFFSSLRFPIGYFKFLISNF